MSAGQDDACSCETARFDGLSAEYRRRLWMVIAINATMFLVETFGGHLAGSMALQADALDFLGDTLTYGITLAVIGRSLRTRSAAAMVKGISLFAMGAWVGGSTLYQFLVLGVPLAPLMGGIAVTALAANMASVLLLMRYKDGDANVRSVWLCSRNDAIGNGAVIVAAGLVWLSASPWPDLLVAVTMAALFVNSSLQILRQSLHEFRERREAGAAGE